MELSDYVRVLRAHWVGVVVLALVSLAVSVGITLAQPKIYSANANGFVAAEGTSQPGVGSINDALAKSRAKSYVDLATSRATAQRVIDLLDLKATPAGLIGQISVVQPEDTVLIKITARSTSPHEAQELANAWVTALAGQVAKVENPSGKGSSPLSIVPIESAALPTSPVSPRVDRNLGLGLVLGLILGLGYAVARSQVDRRLRQVADIERPFGVAVMGSVPAADQLARHGTGVLSSDHLDERDWRLAEALRKLRTNLAYLDVDNPPRVIVITSPQRSDGKSTIATHLAAAIALAGEPVTLVDADLRRPSVAGIMGLVDGAGLTHVLIGKAGVHDLLQHPAHFPGLAVLASGNIPPNPSELLGSKAMRAVLTELSQRGVVIVDAPPLLPVTDAAVLTRHSDGAIVVVSHGKTLDTELGESLSQLAAVQGRVLGVVFNRVPSRRRAQQGYYESYARRDRAGSAEPAAEPESEPESEPAQRT
jgi:capsular exopolysaccharide synthesis family protein